MSEEISPLENHGWWMERLRKDAKANRPEALWLADLLDGDPNSKAQHEEAAAELRRLHAVNQELLEALKAITTAPDLTTLGLVLAMARAAIARAEWKV